MNNNSALKRRCTRRKRSTNHQAVSVPEILVDEIDVLAALVNDPYVPHDDRISCLQDLAYTCGQLLYEINEQLAEQAVSNG